MMLLMISRPDLLSFSNGARPVHSSKISIPKAYTSTKLLYFLFSNISGAIQQIDPTIVLCSIGLVLLRYSVSTLLNPKSVITQFPSSDSKILAAFNSLCIILLWCKYFIPCIILFKIKEINFSSFVRFTNPSLVFYKFLISLNHY